MTADQFRLWIANTFVYIGSSAAIGYFFTGSLPIWAIIIFLIVLAIIFPIVPWAYTERGS